MINVTRVLVKRIFVETLIPKILELMLLNWKLGDSYHQVRVGRACPERSHGAFYSEPHTSSLGSFGGTDSGPCQNHTSLVTLWVISSVLKPSPRVVVERINCDSVRETIFSP